MVVQHNLRAMNSNRMLGLTANVQAKSTEKLSSGYKINRAADDAAGLSISEKMRRQIRGLTQASLNAQDGISSVQTAEGALTEVHDMLQRMDELATKAANGTMSEDDRQNIQDEIDQLLTEIDRVAETTKFNEIYLLKGNAEGTTSEKNLNAHDAGLKGTLVDNGTSATFTLKDSLEVGSKINIAGKEYTIGEQNGSAPDLIDGLKSTADIKNDATGKFGKTTVNVGDSFYDKETDTTYTLVDKVGFGTAGNSIPANYVLTATKSAFDIIHEDGTKTSYTVETTATATGLTLDQANELIKNELAAGSKVVLTKDKSGADIEGGLEVVSALKNDPNEKEISYATLATKNVKTFETAINKLTAGDILTIGGKEYTATANEAKDIDDLNAVIGKLKETDQVAISRKDKDGNATTVTYTVADETNEFKNEYTIADIQSMLQDGDQVTITQVVGQNDPLTDMATNKKVTLGTAYHAVGAPETAETTTITKEAAYDKIAKELAAASSIGAEEGKEATVVNNNDGSFSINKAKATVVDSLSFGLQVGADADMTNKIQVSVSAMDATGLGIKGLNVKDTTGASATYAVDAIEDAIKAVSAQRSALGAVQNRLEHTINNVDNVVENTTAAESQIRDTDMATEMVKYSNNNILAQAGQAMLAQANQSNQGVLSLLG